jgi:hypothetical protein
MVDTLVIKAILLQLMGGVLICHMLYIGVCTTRLHEHDIPHILLLKKAEIAAGQVVPIQHSYNDKLPSLFYANNKRIKLLCKWTPPASSDSGGDEGASSEETRSVRDLQQEEQLSKFVKERIEDVRKHVEDIIGIPTNDFGGLGGENDHQ